MMYLFKGIYTSGQEWLKLLEMISLRSGKKNQKHCKEQGTDKGSVRKINGSVSALIYTLCKHTILGFNGYESLCPYWNLLNSPCLVYMKLCPTPRSGLSKTNRQKLIWPSVFYWKPWTSMKALPERKCPTNFSFL